MEFRTDTYVLAASLKDGDVFETVVSEFCQKMAVALKTYFEFSAVFGVSTRKKEIPLLWLTTPFLPVVKKAWIS